MTFDVDVEVRLSAHGRLLHRSAHERFCVGIAAEGICAGPRSLEYRPPVEDAEGWSRWSLGALFELFGGFMWAPQVVPFEAFRIAGVGRPGSLEGAREMVRAGAAWLRENDGTRGD